MQLRVYVNEDSDGVTCGSFFRFLRHVDIDIRIGSDRRGGQVRHAGAGAIRGFVFHVTDGRERGRLHTALPMSRPRANRAVDCLLD